MSNQLSLIVKQGPGVGRVFTIGSQPQVIGRGENTDIHLADQTLSRRHAKISPAPGGGFTVEDLGSTNGTFINGQPVRGQAPLRPQDVLRLGDEVTFNVQVGPISRDDMETIAPGLEPRPTVVSASRAPQAQQQGTNPWLWVGLITLLMVLLVGGVLAALYFFNQPPPPPPTAAALPPTATPPQQAIIQPTPTETPIPQVTAGPSPTFTSEPPPINVPGLQAISLAQLKPPGEPPLIIDPLCGKTIELDTTQPMFIGWSRRLAESDEPNYVAQWLRSAYYDLELNGQDITTLAGFHYYLGQGCDRNGSCGQALNFWSDLGPRPAGDYNLTLEWYASRQISSGLDQEPADGQPDTYGPGQAGGGSCKISVAAATTPTAPPTPTSPPPPPTATSPPPPPSQASTGPAPVGLFEGFESQATWERGDEPYGTLSRSSGQVHSGSYAGQLSYNFPTGNNDYVVFLRSRSLAGQPNAISAWVYGDGAGHFLNAWIKDAGGQTWQMSFGQIKHTGWQEMTAYLDPTQPWPSTHIGGPDNGAIDYPISFAGLVLDDVPDSYSGSSTIYIDDLTSREGATSPPPTTTAPGPGVGVTLPTTTPGLYVLSVAGQHRYETWGAPTRSDLCEAYNNDAFDDKIHMKGFNIELALTNNSRSPISDGWLPIFITAKGKQVQVCYHFYEDTGPAPGETKYVTFFTVVEPDDYVRAVQLTINGQFMQICLNPSGAQSPC